MVSSVGTPDFGPEYGEAIQRMLNALQPVMKQQQDAIRAKISGHLISTGMLEHHQETIRKLGESLAPATASMSKIAVSPETLESWSRLQRSISQSVLGWSGAETAAQRAPDFRLIEGLGSAALSDPELTRLVRDAEEATPELSDQIHEFSMLASVRESLAPELISAGIYVFIQLAWLAVGLLVTGFSPLAALILDALGFRSDLAGKASDVYLRQSETKSREREEK